MIRTFYISSRRAMLIILSILPSSLRAQSDHPVTDPGVAPTTQPADSKQSGNAKAANDPDPPQTPSASEILKELTSRERNAARPVLRPKSPTGLLPVAPTPVVEAGTLSALFPADGRLFPDGYQLADRPGTLIREADHWAFVFDSREGGEVRRTLRLQPNRFLEDMERSVADQNESVVFIVGGEVSEYYGANYLLLDKLFLAPAPSTTPGQASTVPGVPHSADPKRPPSDSGAAPTPPSATDILRELTSPDRAPARPIIRPVNPTGDAEETPVAAIEALTPNAIAPPIASLFPEGYRLVDRPGRLLRDGPYCVFSFESRGRGAPELPMRLHCNKLLEDMERFVTGQSKAIVFVVSGGVSVYRGANYLLLDKMLIRPDLGNLK